MTATRVFRIPLLLLALPALPMDIGVAYFAIGRTLREPPSAVGATEHSLFERSSCLECHDPIADEWRRSFHFQSLTGPFWQRFRNKGFDRVFAFLRLSGVSCHARANVLDLPQNAHPMQRTQNPYLGVDPVSCHVSNDGIKGTWEIESRAA